MKVYVNYEDGRWRKYKIDFERIANAAAVKCAPGAEVSIILTNDQKIQQLNREYRKLDKPTNVLSFELGDDVLLGDIYVSLEPCAMCATAISFARINNVYYAASDEKGGGISSNAKVYETDRHLWKPNVIQVPEYAGESASLLKDFFAERRKIKSGN